jgi:hypothetical protein
MISTIRCLRFGVSIGNVNLAVVGDTSVSIDLRKRNRLDSRCLCVSYVDTSR